MSVKVEFLTLPNGRCPAEEFLGELENKALAKIYKLIERLETEGRLMFPHARKLEGYKGDTVLLISGFVKKSQKTPRRELERAVSYLRQGGIAVL